MSIHMTDAPTIHAMPLTTHITQPRVSLSMPFVSMALDAGGGGSKYQRSPQKTGCRIFSAHLGALCVVCCALLGGTSLVLVLRVI